MTAIQSSENLSESVKITEHTPSQTDHPHLSTGISLRQSTSSQGQLLNFPTNTQSKLSHPGTIVLSRLKMTTRREGLIIPPLSICIKAALSLKICASSTWYLSEH